MEITDDFERFCQIAQRSPRNSLYPETSIDRRQNLGTYLESPENSMVKRSSSFRETRRMTGFNSERVSGNISMARSPVRSENRSPGYLPDNKIPMEGRRTSKSYQRIPNDAAELTQQNVLTSKSYNSQCLGETDIPGDFHHPNRPARYYRNRPGSMRETRRRSVYSGRSSYRPSAPALYSANISKNEQTSPLKFTNNNPPAENLVRVRKFRCKKDGQIISKADRDVPPEEVFCSPGGGNLIDNRPVIYTNEVSDQSDVDSDSDGEVIEIPAITTTLVNPTHIPDTVEIPYVSPSSLVPPVRNRSRSWAVVSDTERFSSSSRSPPRSESMSNSQVLHVQVLGSGRVGKTSLCLQFETSESLDVNADSAQEDEQTRLVTVEVNNVKFNLEFTDTNMPQEEFPLDDEALVIDSADAYVVVYAIDDRSSFITARSIVNHLIGHCKRSSAIILAANKSDLVRTRAVSTEEGKNLANVYSCPFLEISTSLNHRVDDLLVNIVKAIGSRRREVEKERDRLDKMAAYPNRGSVTSAGRRKSVTALKTQKNTVMKFFQKHFRKKSKPELDE
ncbi:unnamed protein product [Calicophoron daubneyi]|uniref:Uncharacterized protein n=1 Tax=Calicophoron daubneyi TaxID=300641 RepID=A0AAV2TNJ0_CALDB